MTAPTAAPAAPAAPAKGAPVIVRPFVAGTRRGDKNTYDQTRTLLTSTVDLTTYECDPNGFIGGAYILVEAVSVTNAAAVAFKQDGPECAIDTITFQDTNNKPILGPLGGHDLKLIGKYGGYHYQDDPRMSPVYSAVTGAGASAGSFTFVLHLPIEIVKRDALGALTNKSSSATFDINIRLAPIANIYTVAPTNAPTVRVRIAQYGWMDPNATDMRGNAVSQNPPANNTTQYWNKQTYTLAAGAMNQRLIGIDGLVRNLIFVLRDSNGDRVQGEADFPDPMAMQYETAVPLNRLKTIWKDQIGRMYGYNAAIDTPGGRDSGVFVESYCQDFSAKPGYETRLGYLPFSSATTATISGTIGGAGIHTLTVLVNKIVPAGGDPMALTGR
jgi:hypothetical protein